MGDVRLAALSLLAVMRSQSKIDSSGELSRVCTERGEKLL
jgi:hypothetical protein